jgi:hypothetical protein
LLIERPLRPVVRPQFDDRAADVTRLICPLVNRVQ